MNMLNLFLDNLGLNWVDVFANLQFQLLQIFNALQTYLSHLPTVIRILHQMIYHTPN